VARLNFVEMQKKIAFTLIEVIVVMITLAVLLALALPRYTKILETAREKDARINLMAIRGAQLNYFEATRDAFDPGSQTYFPRNMTLTDINQDFHLNIIANNFLYECFYDNPVGSFTCSATSSTGWALSVTADDAPYCSAGTCPTCQARPTGCPANR